MTFGTALWVIVFAYLAGSIPWGLLIGKFNGLDIRRHGSGNIGATNVRRILGRDWGYSCFALDFLKGLVPVLLCGQWVEGGSATVELAQLLAAAAAVCGHVFCCWIKFRGGKGVATTIGALFAVAFWPVIVCLLAWVGMFYLSRYVSVASLSAAVALPIAHIIQKGTFGPTLILLLALAALIIVRHRANIRRLMEGTEHRFGHKGDS
ncbi:MAG: glycerol-3-phosphate 1-O-acyltransferase PlsY [Victivallales bacterium]|jgi:acyl phosphate:glycerol-3-phosphate acyltransferase|nr:glycerol-3-phosphate 1-O-acyltransferase PlsY [Victivallales bacterium]MBT7163979.1 glycerol-3-phosphate 1-O-acyltransferase PlsY [Victivallales bacterium]MBT7304844.1 glycerol-3-phosphate 1-O-acyltransferase PlsY [Victivallales bacterium]